MAERALALLRLKDAAKYLEQGGLARPVRPHEHDALAALRLEVYAAIHHLLAVSMVDVVQLDNLDAAALRLGEAEVQLPVVTLGRLDLVHAVNLLKLALGLRRLGVLDRKSVV